MSSLFIIGLRRSGTTVFWKWFRQDPNLVCFDEPFSEQLISLPADHPKRIWSEFQQIHAEDPDEFWRRYAPIHRADELQPHFTAQQRDYLASLIGRAERTVFDLTRCHLKLEEIGSLDPNGRVIHLVRNERAFASSHLVPSRKDFVGRIRAANHRRTFWDRRGGYDFWGMESLVGSGPGSHFGRLLDADGFDAAGFYRLAAVGRLLVTHRYLTRRADREGAATFGDRFARVSFEDFAARPAVLVGNVCGELGLDAPVSDGTVDVVEASLGHRHDDDRWDEVSSAADAVCPADDRGNA